MRDEKAYAAMTEAGVEANINYLQGLIAQKEAELAELKRQLAEQVSSKNKLLQG